MKVRSITCFTNPNRPNADQELHTLALLVADARRQISAAGIEVQTARLATIPFPDLLSELTVPAAVQLARRLEALAAEHGFDYLSLGPADFDRPQCFALIPDILAATQNVFATGILADAARGVSLPAVRACGEIIARAASISPDGFANLRFAALANVGPFVPFFPAAYSAGDGPAFALAIECADAAVTAFEQASTLQEGRSALLEALNGLSDTLTGICTVLAQQYGVDFKGFDFSLAPFPEDCCSLGGAMERLGVPAVGLIGGVTGAAILADTLDQGRWLRTGFNGMMLPVLEDLIMASRTEGGLLSVKDLLLFSTVCGAGLDTVPLPGNASAGQISAVLLDVASLAVRLGKPLTARLMPVPGKIAGERTAFDFGYFANGFVMPLPAEPMRGLLAGEETFSLHPRRIK